MLPLPSKEIMGYSDRLQVLLCTRKNRLGSLCYSEVKMFSQDYKTNHWWNSHSIGYIPYFPVISINYSFFLCWRTQEIMPEVEKRRKLLISFHFYSGRLKGRDVEGSRPFRFLGFEDS